MIWGDLIGEGGGVDGVGGLGFGGLGAGCFFGGGRELG